MSNLEKDNEKGFIYIMQMEDPSFPSRIKIVARKDLGKESQEEFELKFKSMITHAWCVQDTDQAGSLAHEVLDEHIINQSQKAIHGFGEELGWGEAINVSLNVLIELIEMKYDRLGVVHYSIEV